jgi:hypothetical protein
VLIASSIIGSLLRRGVDAAQQFSPAQDQSRLNIRITAPTGSDPPRRIAMREKWRKRSTNMGRSTA